MLPLAKLPLHRDANVARAIGAFGASRRSRTAHRDRRLVSPDACVHNFLSGPSVPARNAQAASCAAMLAPRQENKRRISTFRRQDTRARLKSGPDFGASHQPTGEVTVTLCVPSSTLVPAPSQVSWWPLLQPGVLLLPKADG